MKTITIKKVILAMCVCMVMLAPTTFAGERILLAAAIGSGSSGATTGGGAIGSGGTTAETTEGTTGSMSTTRMVTIGVGVAAGLAVIAGSTSTSNH